MKERGESHYEQKEQETVFCRCTYCLEPKVALHKVNTIDGQTEWMCGRHKRASDLTGLATNEPPIPTEQDKFLANYIRNIYIRLPEFRREPVETNHVTEVLEDLKVDTWGWERLATPEMRRHQIILVASHNAGLADVKDAFDEDPESLSYKIDMMKINYAELQGIEDLHERQDRNCQIMAYNNGLWVGSEALKRMDGGGE